jgi:hypothetical protein
MAAQHIELVLEVRSVEEVAGVAVLRDKPQRLPLAGSADQDRRMGAPYRARGVESAFEPVVATVEGPFVVAPHLQADPQRRFEALEPLRDRRERQTQAARLRDVEPRADADAQGCPALGQHVESGDHLGQQAGFAIADRGHQSEQLHTLGARRQVYASSISCSDVPTIPIWKR